MIIVDDHTVVRDGLMTMLGREKDFAVMGEARNGLEAVEKVREVHPDVVLMDLRMPELDGVEAMRRIRTEDPEVKFIVLTTYDSDEYIFDAIEAGAKGYLLKDASREELFRAVRAVHRGESLVEPGVAAKLLDRFAQLRRESGRGSMALERLQQARASQLNPAVGTARRRWLEELTGSRPLSIPAHAPVHPSQIGNLAARGQGLHLRCKRDKSPTA